MRLSRFILAASCSSLLICLCALAFIASNRANTQPLNRATQIDSEVAQAQQKTGIVTEIDKTAQQITVLINSKNNGNGSGAIVAREGNTYYVLTASHVIQNPDAYSLVTPDGEQYPLDASQTKVLKGVDLAVVQFTSQKTYAIATLARYKLSDSFWIFVSGFPKWAQGQQPQQLLTAGIVQKEDIADFVTKDGYSLGQGGYGMVYTNQSYRGMSGAPVLDSRGYVIGINTAAENEYEMTQTGQVVEISLGYSLGVPIATFIGLSNQTQVNRDALQVETTVPSQLTNAEIDSIRESLLIAKVPDRNANAFDWVNYGNQLWRFGRDEEAVIAFDKAISLQSDFYQAYYGKGLALQSEDRDTEAIAALEKATQIEPSFAPAWRLQGQSLRNLTQYSQALAAYDRALQLNPEDFALHVERGDILREADRFTEAVKAYNKALTLKEHPWAYGNRGLAYSNLKQYQLALADYDKALSLNPDDALVYSFRGNVAVDLRQYQLALADYDKALSLDPNDAYLYTSRGNAYAGLERDRKALADYDKALSLDPNYTYAYYSRAGLYSSLEQYQKAIADYDKAISLNSNDALSYSARGDIYADLEQDRKALADYNKAISLDPNDAYVYTTRGNVYADLEQYQLAIADYDKAISLDPDYAYAYTIRGNVYADLKQYQLALADYDKAISLDPNDAYAYNRRGSIYEDLEQYQLALTDYDRAISLDPNDAYAYYNRGLTYFNLKQYQLALADFNKLLSVDPNDADAYYYRGSAYLQLKEREKAIADIEKATQLYCQQKNPQCQRSQEFLRQIQTEGNQ